MFFPFQFFWALNMFCRFWTRSLYFQGLESGLVQIVVIDSHFKLYFNNAYIITSDKAYYVQRFALRQYKTLNTRNKLWINGLHFEHIVPDGTNAYTFVFGIYLNPRRTHSIKPSFNLIKLKIE